MMVTPPRRYNYRIGGQLADPYRILHEYNITHPCHQHAIKKLLRCHIGEKCPPRQDIEDVVMTLRRWVDMMDEDIKATFEDGETGGE